MSSARVVDRHAPDTEWAARAFARGELVELEREDPSWPDWLLCKPADGGHAWIPKADLDVKGEVATLTRDYDSTELDCEAGDLVTVERRYGGWALCTTEDGRTGWLPDEKLAPN
jgi:Variant SH3 domain